MLRAVRTHRGRKGAQHGTEGVKFWTRIKTVTARWPESESRVDSSFVIPTMS